MLKRILIILALILILFTVLNLGRQISNALEAGNRLDQAVESYNLAKKLNLDLHSQWTEVSDPSYVEKIARNKLGLARPGETIVIIPDSAIKQVLGTQKVVPPVVKLPNWQGWLKLIFP